jgi:hypothetical protein
MAVEHQPPDVLAMVLADTVLRDFASGKMFIQGTYSAIMATEFPLLYPSIVVYAAITNGHGQTEMELRLVDVDEESEPLFKAAIMMNFADPLIVAEAVFAHGPVNFPRPGEYRLQLFGAGQLLRERRLQAILIQGPPARQ